MTLVRYAERALALSLTLTAAGVFCVLGPSPASASAGFSASVPVGGPQLASGGVIVNLKRGIPSPPAMPGASFLLADMDTGQILVARAPHTPHLSASTMKTLTALTLIPLMNPSTRIMVRPADVGVTGTHLGILSGTSYTVATLMQGLLMASGNDAAYALARGNHSMATTLRQMNAEAAYLGASDTVVRDPSGLDHVGQHTSAYDLALIGRAGMRLPTFRRYVGTKTASLPGGRSGDGRAMPGFKIANHNKLLFNYPGAVGIKNGYTVAAKFTYVEAATRGGKTYLVTEMSSPNGSWRPAAALLNWAFAHGASVTPIGDLVEPGEAIASTPATLQPSPSTPTTPTATPVTATPATATPATAGGRHTQLQKVAGVAGLAGGISALGLVGAWSWRRFSGRRR